MLQILLLKDAQRVGAEHRVVNRRALISDRFRDFSLPNGEIGVEEPASLTYHSGWNGICGDQNVILDKLNNGFIGDFYEIGMGGVGKITIAHF